MVNNIYIKKIYVIAIINISILLSLIAYVIYMKNAVADFNSFGTENWISVDNTSCDNGSWYIDYSMVDNPEHVNKPLLVGPNCDLAKGNYTISIDYQGESTQTLTLSCKTMGVSAYDWKKLTPILDKTETHLDYDFIVYEPIQDFKATINYNGYDTFRINRISISRNLSDVKQFAVIVVFLISLFDIIVLFWSEIKKNRNIVFLIGGVGIFASVPLFVHGMLSGHDLYFHLMRIDGLATDFKYGAIPARMNSAWLQGFGYPCSIYYGDVFLYFPAILRIIGFDITFAYKVYAITINLITAYISYKAFAKIFESKHIAVLLMTVYVLNPYRLMDLYIRGAVGEYTAMMFFPIVVLGIYYIYTLDFAGKLQEFKVCLILAMGMTGIILSHVISTEMICVFIFMFCLVNIKNTFQKKVILRFISSIFLTSLLTLWFLIPFIDYNMNMDIAVNNYTNGVAKSLIQCSGVYVLQLFSIFQSPFGYNNIDASARMAETPGLIGIGTFLYAIYILVTPKGGNNKKLIQWTFISGLFIWISTSLFPWDTIEKLGAIGRLFVQVQFPMRYLGIAILSLTMLLGVILKGYVSERDNIDFLKGIFITSCVCSLVFMSQYVEQPMDSVHRDTADLGVFSEWTYVLLDCNSGDVGRRIMGEGFSKAEIINKEGLLYEIYVVAGESGAQVDVPFFNYKGYKAWDDNGNIFPIGDGYNRDVLVELPANYEGIIKVGFVEPWYWKMGTVVSLVTMISLIIWYIWGLKLKSNYE